LYDYQDDEAELKNRNNDGCWSKMNEAGVKQNCWLGELGYYGYNGHKQRSDVIWLE
jgi:hypothetical protein